MAVVCIVFLFFICHKLQNIFSYFRLTISCKHFTYGTDNLPNDQNGICGLMLNNRLNTDR